MAEYKSTRSQQNENPGETQSFAAYKQEQKEQEKEASKKTAKVAAKGAAMYFGGPEAGAAVDMAANTKVGDQILNKGGEALSKVPGIGKASKKLDDAGVLDKADQALSLAGSAGSGAGAANGAAANGSAQQAANAQNAAKAKEAGDAAKASSGATNKGGSSSSGGDSSFFDNIDKPFGNKNKKDDKDEDSSSKDSVLEGKMKIPVGVKIALISMMPIFIIILLVLIIISTVGGVINNFTDAIDVSQYFELPSGKVETSEIPADEKAFLDRIKEVKEEFSQKDKSVDPLLIVAVYHVANYHDNSISYEYMNKTRIYNIAQAMFSENSTSYSEDDFRKNLKDSIFKAYFPKADEGLRQKYVDEVFDYVSDYYNFVGYTPTTLCAPMGTCAYNIKGFYIYGRGNINKNLSISNLKVRLMESGSGNGHNYGGTFGKAMDNEELVDFEKYILGVAYQEIGPGASEEAFKAQMVAARSYILARPTVMGGWRTLQQENGQWILQTANSTQDQVYCDPDKGCSSANGQWSMVHSGLTSGKVLKQPMPSNSKLRSLANETAGEVLVNSQGYIVYTPYTSTQQNKMEELAKKGYNYKQILLEIYNGNGAKNLGVSGTEKMSCNNTEATCTNGVSGDIASWRQIRGPWINIPLGNSNNTIRSAGCLVTSIAIQMARSGVQINTTEEFNPGVFVQFLNQNGGFTSGGALTNYTLATKMAPNFKYAGSTSVMGYSQDQKYNTLVDLLNKGYYVVAEVKLGNKSGQHWVAVISAQNGEITMVDPASDNTSMWKKYPSAGTSRYVYYKVG